ncbi:MAG TPA: DUF3459 domain-containing protein, partial [Kofleriaceae bacterium]|nr:DUF3459 domain-containing protein [Kofleriaceae bacterium]
EPIRAGRAKFEAQFARLATAESQSALRDPNLGSTFRRCILDPGDRRADNPMVMLHRDLLRLRRDDPAFTDPRLDAMDGAVLADRAFVLRFFQPDGDRLLLVNLGPTLATPSLAEPLIAPLAGQGWRVLWSSEDPRYGGHGTPEPFTRTRLALPARSAIVCVPDAGASLRLDPPPPSGDKVPVEP